MAAVAKAMPIYEAILALATKDERADILRAGPRQHLDNDLIFNGPNQQNADRAYAVIKQVIERLAQRSDLQITGLDPREIPPRRVPLEAEVVLTGRLRWEGPNGIESRLMLEWATPTVTLNALKVEPTTKSNDLVVTMSRPIGEFANERIPEPDKLRLMQSYMDKGFTEYTAAGKTIREIPDATVEFNSAVKRLVRKSRKRATKAILKGSP